MSALAPTEARLALARGIEAGEVVDHGWIRGHITWGNEFASQVVTGRVAEFRVAGLLEVPGPDADPPPRVVRFNDVGRAWLAEHSAAAPCLGCSDDALGPKWGDESLRRPHTCGKKHSAAAGDAA